MAKRATPAGKDQPLKAEIVDSRLVISIGIDTLAHAFKAGPEGDRLTWDDEKCDFDPSKLRIVDPDEFARDVKRALLEEREDGGTPLGDCLDQACVAAVEDGSLGVDYGE